MTVRLQVDALAGRIRRQQDPNGFVAWGRGESGADSSRVLGIRRSVDDRKSVAAEAARLEYITQPLQGRDVLGEDDDALVSPTESLHNQLALDEPQESIELRIGAAFVTAAPVDEFSEVGDVVIGERDLRALRSPERLELGLLGATLLFVGGVVAEDVVESGSCTSSSPRASRYVSAVVANATGRRRTAS